MRAVLRGRRDVTAGVTRQVVDLTHVSPLRGLAYAHAQARVHVCRQSVVTAKHA